MTDIDPGSATGTRKGIGPIPGAESAPPSGPTSSAQPATPATPHRGARLDIAISVKRRHFDVAVELSIGPGEHFVLFGPSGAGKTTVLEAVAGLVRISEGTIALGTMLLTDAGPPYRFVPLDKRSVGLVRQDPGLFPHLSVARNIAFARRLDPEDVHVVEIAAELGIAGMLTSLPGALSGGQRQRVALARVLLSDYRTLLLDEPYTGLDVSLRRELTQQAVEYSASLPSIMVTHELDVAQAFGDRMGIIDEGRLLQVGDPHDVVLRPVSRRVAELVGYRSFVPLGDRLVGVHPEGVVRGEHPGEGPLLRGSVLSVRPAGILHDVRLEIANGSGNERPIASFRLPEAVLPGDELTVTAVNPPYFDLKGSAVPSTKHEGSPGAPGH